MPHHQCVPFDEVFPLWLEWVPTAAKMPAALGDLLPESLGHLRLGATPMEQGSLITVRPLGPRLHHSMLFLVDEQPIALDYRVVINDFALR